MNRQAFQNKRVGVLRMAFHAPKVFGTFEKRAPGVKQVGWGSNFYRTEIVS